MNDPEIDIINDPEIDTMEIIPDYVEIFKRHLPNKLPNEIINIIRNFTYNFEDVVNYHGYILCHNCGNIWDGNAQCNCWEWIDFDENIDESLLIIEES